MKLPSKTDVGNFALAAFIGGNAATLGHDARKEIPAICSSIQQASSSVTKANTDQEIGDRALNPLKCMGSRLVHPLICHENGPLNPAPWSTGEAWGGAAVADGIILAIYAVVNRRKRKEKNDARRKPPTKL